MKTITSKCCNFFKMVAKSVKIQIWEKMELQRVYRTFVALIRVIIRIITYPVLWTDLLVEHIREYVTKNYEKPKEPTSKQIRSRMIAATLDAILENKNSVLGSRTINRMKAWTIVLLEMASFITTAIGMTIVASDISPTIAIIWALVIQGLAGSLSGQRGKWNNIILTICLVFSITSDYVCYVNAVFPYDAHIEKQYTDFKTSYDLARERALELVGDNELSDQTIDIVFNSIDGTMNLLKSTYNADTLDKKRDELKKKEDELENTQPMFSEIIGYTTVFNPITNAMESDPISSDPVENPEYVRIDSERKALDDEVKRMNNIVTTLAKIDGDISKMNGADGSSWSTRIKDLLDTLSNQNTSEEIWEDADNQYNALNVQIQEIQKQINDLIRREKIDTSEITLYDLGEMRKQDSSYTTLQALELPDFVELRESVNKENNSPYDKFFEDAATFIDSEFAMNAVDLKKQAEQRTKQTYEMFIETTAGLVNEDDQLKRLIYGGTSSVDISGGSDSEVVPPLQASYQQVEYKDALSLALSYLIHPGKSVIETYSRVVYACLADGLVLLIGLSMRRKRTTIYRVRSRRDLTNEEPRLISEAFYNLAAKPINNNSSSTYKVETLLKHLNKFISYFETTPFMRDVNLNVNYSLVCKQENVGTVNKEFKELIGLLQSLGYVKSISVKQYNFFKEYKLNKAAIDSNDIVEALPDLDKKDTEYCYLMTEGFALYFYEKVNDLYQNIETNNYRDEIVKELNPQDEKGVEANAVSA